jgi:hypothetical protein
VPVARASKKKVVDVAASITLYFATTATFIIGVYAFLATVAHPPKEPAS